MANDYLNIRCTFCGKHEWIASYHIGSLGKHGYLSPVEAFLDNHFGCNPSVMNQDYDLGENNGFEILTDTQMVEHRKKEKLVTIAKK